MKFGLGLFGFRVRVWSLFSIAGGDGMVSFFDGFCSRLFYFYVKGINING